MDSHQGVSNGFQDSRNSMEGSSRQITPSGIELELSQSVPPTMYPLGGLYIYYCATLPMQALIAQLTFAANVASDTGTCHVASLLPHVQCGFADVLACSPGTTCSTCVFFWRRTGKRLDTVSSCALTLAGGAVVPTDRHTYTQLPTLVFTNV
ncbi:hypothetical protein CBL_01386 [Carabus blaptoides fortunei]